MTGYQFETIFTLEARGHLFLEAITQHFNLCDESVFSLIRTRFLETTDILASKRVDYRKLRTALVPGTKRQERALVFDYTCFSARLYGREVMHALLPHLSKDATQSILAGDWIGPGDFGDWIAVSPSARGSVNLERVALPYPTFYFVYLNNLSDAGALALDQFFGRHPAYLGSLDLPRATPIKAYLATCLAHEFVKHRNVIIRAHEDDRDPSEDYNLSFYDFQRFGLTLRSLPTTLYGIFLSYKIERPALPEELDRKFSLHAMTPNPRPLDDFQVILEEPKLQYLRGKKDGSLKRAGFEGLSAEAIAAQIRAKVDASYIYNLARAVDGDTLKFNVIIETDKGVRAECALEYSPIDKMLRVITFY
jgi:hypothetical protein